MHTLPVACCVFHLSDLSCSFYNYFLSRSFTPSHQFERLRLKVLLQGGSDTERLDEEGFQSWWVSVVLNVLLIAYKILPLNLWPVVVWGHTGSLSAGEFFSCFKQLWPPSSVVTCSRQPRREIQHSVDDVSGDALMGMIAQNKIITPKLMHATTGD